jgi:RNA polymerase sigma-70 factor (ECF subfamily)
MAIEIDELPRLIETYKRMVFSLSLRITGDYATAEEVAQDVFLELHRSGDRLQSLDHTRFWLRRVTVHRATDALRGRALRPEASAEEWLDDRHFDDRRIEAFRMDAASGRGSIRIQTRIEDLLRALPEPLRVAIVLRYQEDMLPDEIAVLLGQPVATVKSHLQRGLKLLRRKAVVTMKEYVRESPGTVEPARGTASAC